MSEKKKYSAYSGLGRIAMVAGIPLMAALGAFVPSLLLSLLAAIFFGPGGLVLGLVVIPVLLTFKKLCETDEQALRILGLEIVCYCSRRLSGLFGNTFTLSPIKYGRRIAVYRRFFRKSDDASRIDQ